ncbi:DNA topoisomerase IB [Bosea sp. 685]|uniref:DNA topoisomerase IB n=1 Tax=Bosea sp. 685 TaxID=3080057 RepID=UPI002892AE4C|nr:DNA topoisomerase IB [Bosea sp. 685]WNJ92662.1 DNA topoisomerase IB [Bosea sp. 685]
MSDGNGLARIRLKRVRGEDLTIQRHPRGRGFSYLDENGNTIRDTRTLARIRSLAVPPAYRDVRIAADPCAHLQALGRDEAGRIQHRYHPQWDRVRERRKLKRLHALIGALPGLRAAVARDMGSVTLNRDKALACAVAIMDRGHIRVGHEVYAEANGSYGASTLLKRHVELCGGRVELSFRGKGGKAIACAFADARLARALQRLLRLPGRRLLQYCGEGGASVPIRADEINTYLRQITGMPISSKDLRMLAGNAAAAELLLAADIEVSKAGRKRQLAHIMRDIAERLTNTPAVVRKSYVHELVVRSFANGRLKASYEKSRASSGCSRIERALARLTA